MTAVRVRDSTATAIGVGGLAQVAGKARRGRGDAASLAVPGSRAAFATRTFATRGLTRMRRSAYKAWR